MVISILVEGKADKKFLEDYIKYLQLKEPKYLINNGKDKISDIKELDQIASSDDNKLVVIFDCDNESADTRKNSIIKMIKENTEYKSITRDDVFLFPNDEDNGELETLLENIAIYGNVLECFNTYTNCIESIKDVETHPPFLKAKIYAYIETLTEDAKYVKEENRDYINSKIFNLENEYLNPLKTFLTGHIK